MTLTRICVTLSSCFYDSPSCNKSVREPREWIAIVPDIAARFSVLLVLLSVHCGCVSPWATGSRALPWQHMRRPRESESEANDELSCDTGARGDVRAAALPSERFLQEPSWCSLAAVQSQPAVDLDCLWSDIPIVDKPVRFGDESMILRLQDDEKLSDEGALFDYAEETLRSLDDIDNVESQESLSLLGRVVSDHCHYYSIDTALVVGVGAGVAATFAHTYVDEEIYRRVHRSVWHGDGHDWAVPLHATKALGEGAITLPLYAGLWLTSELFDEAPLLDVAGEWGERSLRAFLVGGPPLLAMQYLTGGSRPLESEFGSSWQPFQDTNGTSGHAFMGALPLLTAAEMIDWWPGKIAFIVVSFFPGLSRVADDDHYASQALLGWTMAYVAVTAVDRTDNPDRHVSIFPLISSDHVGAAMEYRW